MTHSVSGTTCVPSTAIVLEELGERDRRSRIRGNVIEEPSDQATNRLVDARSVPVPLRWPGLRVGVVRGGMRL